MTWPLLEADSRMCFAADLPGAVAQLGEHRLCKPRVEGSSPFGSTGPSSQESRGPRAVRRVEVEFAANLPLRLIHLLSPATALFAIFHAFRLRELPLSADNFLVSGGKSGCRAANQVSGSVARRRRVRRDGRPAYTNWSAPAVSDVTRPSQKICRGFRTLCCNDRDSLGVIRVTWASNASAKKREKNSSDEPRPTLTTK